MENHPKIMTSAHQLRRHLTQGVDVIRQIFFNLLVDYYSTRFERMEHIHWLSSTVVNEMFSTHTDHTLMGWALYKKQVEQGIAKIYRCNPDLINPFTDALLVHFEVQTFETGRPPIDFEITLKNAMERGFFNETRGNPTSEDFLSITNELVKKYALNS